MFKAEIIADSLSPTGDRLTTFVVTFPRIILAEFNTHRMFSRNSASSRAIPFEKMVKAVNDNPFIPIAWMKDHKGMQGSEYITDPKEIETVISEWLVARNYAVQQAEVLHSFDITKQFCNRLLESFMWHTVIVTSSEWENFFALRAHEAAEIHMQKIAYMMLNAYNTSVPKQLKVGEWHIPFNDNIQLPSPIPIEEGFSLDEGIQIRKVKIATARCARISYTVVGEEEKESDFGKDIQLHDRLLASGHLSPFEHCAMAMPIEKKGSYSGNFQGFVQYRKTIWDENKNDERVILY